MFMVGSGNQDGQFHRLGRFNFAGSLRAAGQFRHRRQRVNSRREIGERDIKSAWGYADGSVADKGQAVVDFHPGQLARADGLHPHQHGAGGIKHGAVIGRNNLHTLRRRQGHPRRAAGGEVGAERGEMKRVGSRTRRGTLHLQVQRARLAGQQEIRPVSRKRQINQRRDKRDAGLVGPEADISQRSAGDVLEGDRIIVGADEADRADERERVREDTIATGREREALGRVAEGDDFIGRVRANLEAKAGQRDRAVDEDRQIRALPAGERRHQGDQAGRKADAAGGRRTVKESSAKRRPGW